MSGTDGAHNNVVVFPMGKETLTWVRQGGKPERAGMHLRFLIAWQSFWFEGNLALQHRLVPCSLPDHDPIFVLGLWRSGTTFLHDLLGACPGMIYPATWQCMNPSVFRLRPVPFASKAVQRPMDGVTIDTFSPQEDEFALLALGVPSVYRAFFDPRRLGELTCWLDPSAWSSSCPEGWLKTWREFLAGVAETKRANRSADRLLLKSPNHTFRIRALTESFPDASYIWMVRDPVETFFSNRKMWLSMFSRYSLWSWDESVLDAFLVQAFRHATNCLEYAVRTLPRGRLVVVEFSRLTTRTRNTLGAITLHLHLDHGKDVKNACAPIAKSKNNFRVDSYAAQTMPEDAVEVVQKLEIAQLAALKSHGI